MSGDEGVVFALPGLGEAGEAAELPQGVKQSLPAGEGLVDVALVPHVEHQPVLRCVEDPVDGHRQLHRSQVGGQMAAGFGHMLHQELPQLPAQGLQLFPVQGLHIRRGMDIL